MRGSVRGWVMALAVAGLASTGPALAQDVGDEAPETEAACDDAGGRWAVGGRAGQPLCFLPTPDAGNACSLAEACAGFCLAESRSCSVETPLFGCVAILDLDGAEVTICID